MIRYYEDDSVEMCEKCGRHPCAVCILAEQHFAMEIEKPSPCAKCACFNCETFCRDCENEQCEHWSDGSMPCQ